MSLTFPATPESLGSIGDARSNIGHIEDRDGIGGMWPVAISPVALDGTGLAPVFRKPFCLAACRVVLLIALLTPPRFGANLGRADWNRSAQQSTAEDQAYNTGSDIARPLTDLRQFESSSRWRETRIGDGKAPWHNIAEGFGGLQLMSLTSICGAII
jgi:hypothetical protein